MVFCAKGTTSSSVCTLGILHNALMWKSLQMGDAVELGWSFVSLLLSLLTNLVVLSARLRAILQRKHYMDPWMCTAKSNEVIFVSLE